MKKYIASYYVLVEHYVCSSTIRMTWQENLTIFAENKEEAIKKATAYEYKTDIPVFVRLVGVVLDSEKK